MNKINRTNLICVGRIKRRLEELIDKSLIPRSGGYTTYILQNYAGERVITSETEIRTKLKSGELKVSNLYIDDSDRIIFRKVTSIQSGSVYLNSNVLGRIEKYIEKHFLSENVWGVHVAKYTHLQSLKFKRVENINSYLMKSRLIGASSDVIYLGVYPDIAILASKEKVEIISETGFTAPIKLEGLITKGATIAGFTEYDFSGIDFQFVENLESFIVPDALAEVFRRSVDIKCITLPEEISKAKLREIHRIFSYTEEIKNIDKLDTSNVNDISYLSDNAPTTIKNKLNNSLETFLNIADLSKVENTTRAFAGLDTDKLDITKCKINIPKLKTASGMFSDSNIGQLITDLNFDFLEDGQDLFRNASISVIKNKEETQHRLIIKECNCLSGAFSHSKLSGIRNIEIGLKGELNSCNMFLQANIPQLSEINLIAYGDCLLSSAFNGIKSQGTLSICTTIIKAENVNLEKAFSNIETSGVNITLNFIDTQFNERYLNIYNGITSQSYLNCGICLSEAFNNLKANKITIAQNDDTPFLVELHLPFIGTIANKIDMSTLNLENLTYTVGAFSGLCVNELDLSGTHTKRLEAITKLFDGSNIINLLIGDWSKHKLNNRERQFKYFEKGAIIRNKQGIWFNGADLSKEQ